MLYRYDLHIHSALSPCAENDMTPVSIVGQAALAELDFVAVADHNSIRNVQVAIMAGEAYGVKVVPAMELQTNEDIHILCMFPSFEKLKAFYECIRFSERANRADIFGEQLVFDEDDNIIGREESMLLDSAKISSEEVPALAAQFDGAAVPAHIDRDSNSMLQILGVISGGYPTVELSTKASEEMIAMWRKTHNVIIDSDSHTFDTISVRGAVELPEYSVEALLEYIRKGR